EDADASALAGAGGADGSADGVGAPTDAAPGGLDRLRALARRAVEHAVMTSQLAERIGRRQAFYLARVLALFDHGELDEALRRAVPLGSGDDAAGVDRLALGLPPRRETLDIRARRGGGARLLGGHLGLYLALEMRYRRAYEQLVAQGKIDEAAFVLAELLGASEEAVALLERHGRLRLAAEIAEARRLPAGLAVRLWFQAGEVDRAVRLARRAGAFADAVLALARIDPARADVLRLRWAEHLARSGDYLAAVRTVEPLRAYHPRARRWIQLGLEMVDNAPSVDPTAAALLAYRAGLDGEHYADTLALVRHLLRDRTAASRAARRAFVATLVEQPMNPATETLARLAARSLVRAAPREGCDNQQLRRLLGMSGDRALRSDVRGLDLAARRPPQHSDEPGRITISAGDAGTLPIHDAVALPEGRVLLALGEIGVRVVNRRGRTVMEAAQPAHRLVIADHGGHAITLAARGDAASLGRIDLAQRRVRDWCDARVDAFAASYDGSMWFLSADDALLGIDAQADGWRALWRVGDLPPAARRVIARSETRLAMLTVHPWACWRYELPSLILRGRDPVAVADDTLRFGWTGPPALTAGGLIGLVECHDPPMGASTAADGDPADAPINDADTAIPGRVALVQRGQRQDALPLADADRTRVHLAPRWLALVTEADDGAVIDVRDLETRALRLHLRVQRSPRPRVRLAADHLTVCDRRGRVLVYDLARGALVHDLRI
ncbi:MAG: hypothetical protein AAF772_17900, partial [Acidobacteriota bacterium]